MNPVILENRGQSRLHERGRNAELFSHAFEVERLELHAYRGKLLNVRDASSSQITNNAEISNIKQIMGLQYGKVRTSSFPSGLRTYRNNVLPKSKFYNLWACSHTDQQQARVRQGQGQSCIELACSNPAPLFHSLVLNS